ncbi:MAG: hypothetical protein IJD97_02750 [Clostridia bacterium]|nr:hypothetical protein [Clostridia bacterium]
MEKRQIINIVNFIRDTEPRLPMDLITPVKMQIELMKKHNLKGTFLLQYDALTDKVYQDMLKELDPSQFEIGVWLEIVEPQVKKAGLTWRGRYSWDWATNVGFSVGYTKEEREKLIDVLFTDFNEIFGYYPKVLGSWLYDTHTIKYANEKYGLSAICNCKEQYGTDGYTLWGGYYGQGYYPSKNNVFLPAGKCENQIDVPLFRMLGSDPVYQFDHGMSVDKNENSVQGVITLEPAATEAGGNDFSWIDWYLKENFNGDCLSFGYAQAGQENSFGWARMGKGLTYQFEQFEKLQKEGEISVETLGESGEWFKKTYTITPASAITAHSAYNDEDKSSVWYSSKNYRINLYLDHGKFRIRDIHIFSDKLNDPFMDEVCTTEKACYEALPFIDGNRYSGNGILAGGYIEGIESFSDMSFSDLGDGCAKVSYGSLSFELKENSFKIEGNAPFSLKNMIGIDGNHKPSVLSLNDKEVTFEYGREKYRVKAKTGKVLSESEFSSEGNCLLIEFETEI